MPIHKPTKRLGKSIALKAAQKRIQSRMARAMWTTLNLTAMVDIFTILVVFLLANFSATGEILFMSKDIVLPKADATAELYRAPVISISEKGIAVEGRRVYFTEEAASSSMSTLMDVTYELQEIRKADQLLHPGAAFKGNVILQCHEDIEFTVVRKVMYAAAAAGYVDMNYAVMSEKSVIAPHG